ncbi:MAG TPA: hypothetical protein VFS12_16070, partial [Terriglobia bacterium]|nr:hypothetical protein [Terriglobia bacterium]
MANFRNGHMHASAKRWIATFRQVATGGKRCRHVAVLAVLVLTAASFAEVAGLTTPLHAQEAATTLAGQLQQLIDQPKWESALWGVHILSLK